MTTLTINLPKPTPAQKKIRREALRFNVLECGRRFGKTTAGLTLACETAIEGQPSGWFGPSYKSMSEQWRQAERWLAEVIEEKDKKDHQMRLVTGGILDFWSLDNVDAGRGRKYKRIVIDEASLVRDLEQAWQESIRPTLTDLKGDGWFLFTPKGRRFAHHLYMRAVQRKDWQSWRFGTIDNPGIDPQEIEDARRDLPQHVFDQEFRGIPADDGGCPFDLKAIGDCVTPISDAEPFAFGVDLAKSHDWTVVIGLDAEGRVCRAERWQSDWKQTRDRILAIVNGWPTLIDSTGVGDPIVEEVQRVRGQIEGFKFTAQSKQQLMEGLAAGIQGRTLRFPEGFIRNELETFEYEYTRTGVRYTAPSGLHDDAVCALALALRCWHQSGAGQPMTVRLLGAGVADTDEDERGWA